MTNITVVTARYPVSVRSDGITARIVPIVEYLAGRHRLQIVVAREARAAADRFAREARERYPALQRFRPHAAPPAWRRRLRTLTATVKPYGVPYEQYRHESAQLAQYVDRCSQEHGAQLVFWLGGFAHALLLYRRRAGALPCVLDWIDSPSLYLARRRPDNLFWRQRVASLGAWERRINALAQASVYVSPVDAAFTNADSALRDRVSYLPNGVYDDMPQDPHPPVAGAEMTVGFLGHMGYGPNIQAARCLHDRIIRPLQAEGHALRLKIIGHSPSPEVRALASERVEVTGSVESIWPHLNDCHLMVFPMSSGAGLQNKLLESMRAARPIVASDICLAPFGPAAEDFALPANNDQEMRSAIARLVTSPPLRARLARNGRRYVEQFQWRKLLPAYEQVLLKALDSSPQADRQPEPVAEPPLVAAGTAGEAKPSRR